MSICTCWVVQCFSFVYGPHGRLMFCKTKHDYFIATNKAKKNTLMDETHQTKARESSSKGKSKRKNKGHLLNLARFIKQTVVYMFTCYRPNISR